MWRIARDTGVLDLNSSYGYLLWRRDFSGPSVVARDARGRTIGFITVGQRPAARGEHEVLFDEDLFTEGLGHAPEVPYLIGPAARPASQKDVPQ
ncbi:hypothetical protein A4E84_36775 [Streptomyces qaidamensis]|uniref:Uncharacterized protein n=2 Tax=Streptomyces qaidamensis TaxID=1783515 RepID=A0A143CAS2_9ACTN|nr:hypothetical protein [Streptomyces qaidamensis]AMW14551.1 hypothetical protein A4E84_36775 [Streptomyces qaidamensis]